MSLSMSENVASWVGGIPDTWNVTPLKHLVKKLERPMRPDSEVLICSNSGNIVPRGDNNPGLVSLTDAGYQGVEPGDLLIHGMDTWHGAIAVSELAGKCTSVVHVCDSKHDKRFIAYYLRMLAYRSVYKAFSNGVRQNTSDFRSWVKAGEIPVLVPTFEEQRRIADYLDDQCNEIDTAIRAAEASIEGYEHLRDAIIFDAVTQGVTQHVEHRASRVTWTDTFPSHWEQRKIKYVLHERNESNSDLELDTVLSLSARYGVTLYSERVGGGNKAKASLEDYKKARAGDIVLNSMNIVSGSVGISPYDGCVSPVYYMFYLNDGEGDIRFFNYVFQSDRFQKSLFGLGNGIMVKESSTGKLNTVRMRISPSVLKSQFVPVPPIEEQSTIADYLDQRCSAIDQLIRIKESIVEDLRYYKQSLVYEVVTGKREV